MCALENQSLRFGYEPRDTSYWDYQPREPSPPNHLVADVVELALVEFQYDESRGSYPKRTLWFSKAHTFEGGVGGGP